MITIDQVVHAIYITEGGPKTSTPYGIRSIYTTNPHRVCVNTVRHALQDYKPHKIDKYFVYFLADRYCPPSCDRVGNARWKINMVRILHL